MPAHQRLDKCSLTIYSERQKPNNSSYLMAVSTKHGCSRSLFSWHFIAYHNTVTPKYCKDWTAPSLNTSSCSHWQKVSINSRHSDNNACNSNELVCWQLVINLTVHLLIPLSFESLRSINIFGGGSNDCNQALAIFFRMNLSRDVLAAMAADALCFNITKHL